MAVYYKFSAEKSFRSISIEGHFITVGDFKDRISNVLGGLENKISNTERRRRWKDDIAISDALNNEEYVDEATLIPKFTSIVIRKAPRYRRNNIVVAKKQEQVVNAMEIDSETSFSEAGQSAKYSVHDFDIFDFGDDVYANPEVTPSISSNPVNISKADNDENSKIQALVNTSALDAWQNSDGIGRGSGFGRGRGTGNLEQLKPPQGYVCHRCKIPGHFIQHCPTNGDPNFDIKRFNTVKPNVSAFRNKVRGFPDSRSTGNLPPELYCLLCERVMKDAVFSKCCFRSFCENCIRDQVISKSNCVCGATGRPANDFVPNNAVRDTIKRILETNYSSAGNCDQDKQFALPAALKGGKTTMQNVEATEIQCAKKVEEPLVSEQEVSDITKEPALQGSALTADNEVQHKEVTVDAGKEFALPAASIGGEAPLQNVGATKVQENKKLEESLISQPEVSDITKEPTLQGSALPVDKELQHKKFTKIQDSKLAEDSSIFQLEESGITKDPALQDCAPQTNKVHSKEVTKIQDSKLEEGSSIFQPEASGIKKEQALQGSALPANKVQHKEVTVETEKKKSKRKSNLPLNAAEIQWTTQQYDAAQSYMQPIYPFSYHPYWNSMHPGMEAYMKQCWMIPPHMGYDIMPTNVPFGVPGMTSSQISPHSRESSENRECHREVRKSVEVASVKLKRASNMISTPPPPPSSSRAQRGIHQPRQERQYHKERKEQSPRLTSPVTASKRKSSRHSKEYDDSYHQRVHHKHHKEHRRHHGTPSVARRAVFRGEYDSSDDEERHFKRRRSRYE